MATQHGNLGRSCSMATECPTEHNTMATEWLTKHAQHNAMATEWPTDRVCIIIPMSLDRQRLEVKCVARRGSSDPEVHRHSYLAFFFAFYKNTIHS